MLTHYNADQQNFFSRNGKAHIHQLKMLEEERWLLTDLFEDLDEAEKRISKLDERLAQFAQQASQAEREARAVLATFSQMGPVTTEVILAELGDWRRFKNAAAEEAYAGLDPGVRASDDKRRDLRLSKSGSPPLLR